MVGRNTSLKEEVVTHIPKIEEKKTTQEDAAPKTSLPFDPRKQIQGLNVLLIGKERGYLFYYPVLILSVLGIISLVRSLDKRFAIYGITSISLIISMYSMFGDPWGGWAFGARYLIPANALLSVFLGVAIAKFAKNILFSLAFISLSAISIYVNTIGTLTTSAIPPKGEAEALPNPTPYTIEYNKKLIAQNQSSSLVYNNVFRQKISLDGFSKRLSISILVILIFIYLSNLAEDRPKRQQI
jgi:hypothetical protein